MNIDIATLIGQYAFPIVACIAMAYYVKYTGDKHSNEMSEMRKEHKTEIEDLTDRLTEALQNNTLALTKLVTLIGGVDDDKSN